MKIYFDESGNTGCVINRENKLTFATQPIFVIGAVLVDGSNDEKRLIKKYQRFKQLFVDDFMTYGWYDNPELTNVINLNAVSKLIYSIKATSKIDNNSIEFVHDHIFQFEETIATELNPFDINISFADSKDEELLQLADNVASISYHAMVRMVNHFSKKEEWKKESEWDMTLVSSILRKLGQENIKFTMPIQDWSAAVCVKQMFGPGYPKARRKNIFFNEMYKRAQYEIAQSINYFNCESGEIDKTMKR